MDHQNESHDDNCTEHEFASKKKKRLRLSEGKRKPNIHRKNHVILLFTVKNTLCYRAFTAVGKSSARGKLH